MIVENTIKNLYAIYHIYDEDGGFGDAVTQKEFVGAAWATDEEIEEYLKKWDKPEEYDRPYASLIRHCVMAELMTVSDDIKSIKPYGTDLDDWFVQGIECMKNKYCENKEA